MGAEPSSLLATEPVSHRDSGVTDRETAPDALPAAPGDRIAERYVLGRLLGQGGHGAVWEALDTVAKTTVAVKLVLAAPGMSSARVRREVSALRLLQMPGVVRLLDEGVDGDRAFLVLERVDGAPFPGTATRCDWTAIARTTLGLLETLGRIHAAGVVHRDLKPANVLVDSHGRPTVLDFGVSFMGVARAGDLTRAGQMLGTPAYLAPEQIRGGAVTARADVYAIGAMLYEALSGRVPNEAHDASTMLYARLVTRPTELRDIAPAAPKVVCDVIMRLLAIEPAERPQSALEVLALLRGETSPSHALPRWLGSREPIARIAKAVRAGRAVDIASAPGGGRTRWLHELAASLQAGKRRVVWTVTGRNAFASLEPLIGPLHRHDARSLDAITELVEKNLRRVLARGTVLLVDDVERIDRESAAVIARVRKDLAVVRAFRSDDAGGRKQRGAVAIEPLTEATLRDLFRGPDLLLHLREDSARLLHARTEGNVARVASDLNAWVRAGLAQWDGSLVVIDRASIDRLDTAGSFTAGAATLEACVTSLPPYLDELLAWISLAAPHADASVLSSATGLPRWRIESQCGELVEAGAVRRDGRDRWEPRRASAAIQIWTWERRLAAHVALADAMPRGTDARLSQLLAAAAGEHLDESAYATELAHESGCVADAYSRAGHLGRASAALAEALRVVRQFALASTSAARSDILSRWSVVALAEHTPGAADRVLYEICREGQRDEHLRHLESLVRASLAVAAGTARALAIADTVPAFDDLELDRRRQVVRVTAARRGTLQEEVRVAGEVGAWSRLRGSAPARATYDAALGWLRYREGRFAEAAALHASAAANDPWLTAQIAGHINAGSALLESGRPGAAAIAARRGLVRAVRCRHALLEGRARWVLRCSEYRRGRAVSVDRPLIDAASTAFSPQLAPLIQLNEAAVAFRAGQTATAGQLAAEAFWTWRSAGWNPGAVLTGAIFVACGGALPRATRIELVHAAQTSVAPPLGVQALALMSRSALVTADAREWASRVVGTAQGVRRRREVLSLAEALERLGGLRSQSQRIERRK